MTLRRLRRPLLLASLIAMLPPLAGAGQPVAGPVSADEPSSDRLIIKYRAGSRAAQLGDIVSMGSAHEAVNRRGAQMTRLRANAFNAHVMALDRPLPASTLRTLADEIVRGDANVEYAEPDLRLTAQFVPNDPSYLSQWQYHEATAGLNLPTAWNSSTGTGVVVAVVDTGYRPHVDLAANIVGGYDMIATATVANDGGGRDSSALDTGDASVANECYSGSPASASSWHGTHVAGSIAALSNNGVGVAGVAFGAKLLPVRALGKCGGYTSDIADAVIWAAGGTVSGTTANANPARVINLSLGGSGSCGTTMQSAINSARSRGAVVVVAAGNSNTNASGATPANCHGVTTVAAVGRSGARAYYSNYGANVDVAAPGGDMRSGAANGILSTLNSGSSAPGADSYAYYQGTSMATPHVAGVAALMMARNPALTVEQVESLLRSSVRAFPVACSGCGTGLLDASLAVAAAASASVPSVTAVAEVESNNTVATAQVVSPALATVSGSLSSSSDLDHFRVSVPVGKTLTARLTPNSGANYNLYLYNTSGTTLASSTASGNGVVDTVVYSNNGTASASYVIGVRRVSGGTGSYVLQLTQ